MQKKIDTNQNKLMQIKVNLWKKYKLMHIGTTVDANWHTRGD